MAPHCCRVICKSHGQGQEDGDRLPRSARGRRMRPPSHRMDSDSSEDDEPPSPTVNIPRCGPSG